MSALTHRRKSSGVQPWLGTQWLYSFYFRTSKKKWVVNEFRQKQFFVKVIFLNHCKHVLIFASPMYVESAWIRCSETSYSPCRRSNNCVNALSVWVRSTVYPARTHTFSLLDEIFWTSPRSIRRNVTCIPKAEQLFMGISLSLYDLCLNYQLL